MRTLLTALIFVLVGINFSYASSAQAGKSHFEAANTFTVKVRSSVDYPFVPDYMGSFSGAGFLIRRDLGWIATNAHVASQNPSSLSVAFKGRRFVDAELVYVDHLLDFTVIKIATEDIPDIAQDAPLDCESEPVVGTPVGAYGHPFGLSYSGTRGIISGDRYRWDRHWVQTDAPINSGNSGGPLINLDTGRVLGINSATFSKRMSEGIGFAVPMPQACRVIELLERNIDPSPPYIPVNFAADEETEIDLVVAVAYEKQPVFWSLRSGDRILSLAENTDEEFTSQAALMHALRGKSGDVDLLIERAGKTETVSVPIQTRANLLDRIGVHVSGIVFGKQSMKDDELANPDGLLFIHNVKRASKGSLAGVEHYDYLVSVDGQTIKEPVALCNHLKAAHEAQKKIRLVTQRGSWEHYRSQTTYFSHEIKVSNVRLVGPRAPEGCGET
jgi:S1-C subfamily serine protease